MKIVIVTRSLGQIRKPLTKEFVEKFTGRLTWEILRKNLAVIFNQRS